jgi:hypothetical protein
MLFLAALSRMILREAKKKDVEKLGSSVTAHNVASVMLSGRPRCMRNAGQKGVPSVRQKVHQRGLLGTAHAVAHQANGACSI